MKRKSLQFRRDKSGGLIAGATLEIDQSLAWADSRPISPAALFGHAMVPLAQRDPADDEALLAMQEVDVHRFRVNNGTHPDTGYQLLPGANLRPLLRRRLWVCRERPGATPFEGRSPTAGAGLSGILG